MTIQFRWRQQQSSFKKKLNNLKELWNNTIFMLLEQLNENDDIDSEKRKEKIYFLKYVDKITEYVNYFNNLLKKKKSFFN